MSISFYFYNKYLLTCMKYGITNTFLDFIQPLPKLLINGTSFNLLKIISAIINYNIVNDF